MSKFLKIGTPFLAIIILSFMQASGKGVSITRQEIGALEKSGHLVPVEDGWRTKGGLIIKGRDPRGITRLEHIMRHASDIPKRKKHGVFTISKEKIIELMDEMWQKIQAGELHGKERGGRVAYTYHAKRELGYLGGKEGRQKGHPKIESARIVVSKSTHEVITFFPY